MTEESYAESMYPRARRAAKRLSVLFHNRVPAEDLTQAGVLAAVRLYRKQCGEPLPAIAGRAIWREMIDVIRREIGRVDAAKRAKLTLALDLGPEDMAPDKFTWLTDGGEQMRALERHIDFEGALRFARADERRIFARTIAGDSLEEIGHEMGVHLSRVQQIRRRGIERMQHALA